jgi:Fe-S cluster assembly protein SufD
MSASATLDAGAQSFLARYAGLKDRLPGDAALREAGAQAFARNGLPGVREEAWRYTPLRPLAETAFHEPLLPLADCGPLLARLPALDAPRLIFIDGRFRHDLSAIPPGVTLRTGAPAFGAIANLDEKLVALNTMLAEDGAAIAVAEGIDAGTILLANLGSAANTRPVAFHPRHDVTLARGARLTLVEVNTGAGIYFNNPVLSATVAEDATLTHLRFQQEAPGAFHLATIFAEVASRGTYDSFSLALGGRLARAEIHARLAGERATAHLNAAQLLGGTQHADFTTIVRHDAPATASRQTVKNVLTGRARGVFQGKIEVARIAQKTDGYQMNQTLLLSRDAEIDSKPQLEIYADDVKCSHGATVGELDAAQLFYLQSRGIPAETARNMLIRAFLSEALDPIAHEGAREAMEAAIAAWWERDAA